MPTALMLDLETIATGPHATILTCGAQTFDMFGTGYLEQNYYARIDFESQAGRDIDDATLEWWGKQSKASREEAFNEADRIPLKQALEELGRVIWNKSFIWANGTTFDMSILEDAYKTNGLSLPWQYHRVRDARTIYSLWPALPKPPTEHHALEDCRRQIDLLQQTFHHLDIRKIR